MMTSIFGARLVTALNISSADSAFTTVTNGGGSTVMFAQTSVTSAPRIAARVEQTLDVLVEGAEEDGQLYGRAQCQAPDVDGVTYVPRGEVGEIVSVRICDTLLYEMEGE